MTLIQVSPLDDDVQPGSATWCALPCCLLADWGCCAVQLPNGAAGVCGGRGAAGVCGGRMALQGVRLPNGAAVCDCLMALRCATPLSARRPATGVCGGRVALQGVRRPNGAADTMWARGSVQSYGDACELCFLK